MLKIAITGGIGSGKSTVATLFAKLGVPVIDADKIAHDITEPHQLALDTIVKHFGRAILNPDATLNRHKLRDIVFHNMQEKQWLEETLHPIIIKIMKAQITKLNTPYCILVIPLLVESNDIDFVDRVLVVDAPESLQIERTQERSRLDEKTIHAIMQSQASRTKRLAIADDVIVNDQPITVLQDGVSELHSKYLELAH
ncbi:dephospho-CoA kinase [Candidiatus Paracoxiella cheracis]|uniref:dephospho-CoA kinase n=1 Tax=Candidiatus Paracoxiella cheracis TaxID=3405120 RepID=UPI003BF5C25B